MRMRNLLLAAVVFALLGVSSAWTYTVQYANGHYLRWLNKATDKATISMVTNLNFPTQSKFNSPDIVHAVIAKVMGEWNSTLSSNGIGVAYADGGTTTTVRDVACDGVNVITFTNSDPNFSLPSGVLAAAWLQSVGTQPAYPVSVSGCGPANITLNFAEQIVDADIEFNINLVFSTNGLYVGGSSANIANDIEGTLRHEMGHVLGLHHSGVISALMVPRSQQNFPNRGISADDVAGINAAYGVNAPGGAISGSIRDSTGAAVLGAHVVLVDNTTGFTTVSALSDVNGNYSIVGFAPGTYKIYAQPLDGPENISILNNFPAALFGTGFNNSFATTFVTNPVTMAKGIPTTGFNITVGAVKIGTASLLTVGQTTVNANGTVFNSATGSTLSAPRGNTVTVCMNGVGLTGDVTTSAPTSKVAPVTATAIQANCSGALGRNFTIAPDAAAGYYDVYAGNAALSGSLYVSTSPVVGAGGVVDGASFGKAPGTAQIAQGSIISIFGTDLAPAVIPEDGFPVPTQLGNVSVRIGDRWAPLYIVTPGQINAMVPYEVSGTVPVQIEAGNNSVFAYGNITVVPSAPRIFVVGAQDSAGGGAGAIQNGSKGYVIVNSTNPASAGDVLVIYCEGLGPTTPASPSGIAPPASLNNPQIAGQLSVNIGGRNAVVQFQGVSPGFTGLYQVNAIVPTTGLSANNATPVYITDANGNKSNIVTIAIH